MDDKEQLEYYERVLQDVKASTVLVKDEDANASSLNPHALECVIRHGIGEIQKRIVTLKARIERDYQQSQKSYRD